MRYMKESHACQTGAVTLDFGVSSMTLSELILSVHQET
jgi:hypothetical protein